VKVGSGVAVKCIEVAVGCGSGVLEGCGVLLGSGDFVGVAVGSKRVGVLLGWDVGVGGTAVFVGCGVFVVWGDGVLVLVEPGRGVLVAVAAVSLGGFVAPGCAVSVARIVGVGDGVRDGVELGATVAVWALAVSVAAMTVCTIGCRVWVGAGVGVGQATSVGAKSQ